MKHKVYLKRKVTTIYYSEIEIDTDDYVELRNKTIDAKEFLHYLTCYQHWKHFDKYYQINWERGISKNQKIIIEKVSEVVNNSLSKSDSYKVTK